VRQHRHSPSTLLAVVRSREPTLTAIFLIRRVPQPYFNEPGYEGTIGTPAGDAASFSYNAVIREATIKYAMCDHLKYPKPGAWTPPLLLDTPCPCGVIIIDAAGSTARFQGSRRPSGSTLHIAKRRYSKLCANGSWRCVNNV
jgi:hypothetical protein